MPWERISPALLIRKLLWNTSKNNILDNIEDIIKDSLPDVTVNNTTLVDNSSYTTVNNNLTSYVSNRHSTYNNTVNKTVINNFSFPPLRRQPTPIDRPTSILPTDIDNQTTTTTKVGSSINVSQSLNDNRNSFERLIHNPLSLQRVGIIRSLPTFNFIDKINTDLTEAVQAREDDPDIIPGSLAGYLIGGKYLGGLSGEGTSFLGLKAISTYAQMNRVMSSLAFIEPLNTVAIQYTDVTVDDNYSEFSLDPLTQDIKEDTPLWEKLGYEENVFKNKSIETIIKDFVAKIYQLTNPNDPDYTLLPINENFTNVEQFIAGTIATLFHRLGLLNFPVENDQNPIRNMTDIILLLLGILNLLKDNNEEEEKPIWELLGYSEGDFKGKTIEDVIKDFGQKIYQNKQVTSLNDDVLNKINSNFDTPEKYLTGIVASLFFRNGLHRLPGELPESLCFDTDKYQNASDQPTIFVEDMMEYQQYLIKNLDEIFGRFPINFKYKSKDEDGNNIEVPIKFENIAECLLEISGLVMDINNTADVLTNIGLKNLNEGIRAVNGGYLSVDMLKVILDYLGCDYEEYFKKRPLPITQDATSFPEFLKDSEVDRLSVKNKDKSTLKTNIHTLLINTTIAKLALAQRKDFITGDAIRDVINRKTSGAQAKYDEQWEELIKEYTRVNPPTPTTKFPKAKVIDRSINNPTP